MSEFQNEPILKLELLNRSILQQINKEQNKIQTFKIPINEDNKNKRYSKTEEKE